jgi:hypothetical protein
LIVACGTALSIYQQNHDMGLFNGQFDLPTHPGLQLTLIAGHPTRINDNQRPRIRPRAHSGKTVHAVSRKAGKISHQGILAPGQTIK